MADQRTPSDDPQAGQSWLRRVLTPFVGRARPGDMIAANVEQGARGVAVGKNIVQIGTLAVPVWPLFALLLVLGAGAGLWALSQRGPAEMQGQFNVAVARFVERDGQDNPRASTDRLGALVFDTLQASYPQPNPALLLWRDGSVSWRRQGAQIGTVITSTQAITVTRRINADVLIYGELDQQARFTLQFYVSQRPGIYGDANAIVGSYRFGEPIQLDPADIAASSDALTSRTGALVALVKGLRADSRGNFAEASASYDEAERLLPAGVNSGKAIIAYFKGQSSYYNSVFDPTAKEYPQLLEAARQSFTEALRNDPAYARAQIGLGSVFLQQAMQQNTNKRLQNPELGAAIDAYKRAAALAADTSEQSWVEAVATQGLATAYYVKGGTLFQLHNDAAADPVLQEAAALIEQIQPALKADHEYRLLAQANQTLGNVLFFRAKVAQQRGEPLPGQLLFAQSDQAYANCVAQIAEAPNDETLHTITDGCTTMRKQVSAALQPTQESEK